MRALAVLRSVDFVAAEDTRRTRQLLYHFGLSKQLVSLHEHNEVQRSPQLIERLLSGETAALVTDAGMPGISDPGAHVVRAVRDAGLTVVAIPGPAAVTTALAGSGAPADRFVFDGFLPRRGSERRMRLAALAAEERTIVLYEAPHRLAATLADLAELLPTRTITVARELTKIHEEYRTGTAAELLQAFAAGVRGELTIVIHAGPAGHIDTGKSEGEADRQADWLATAHERIAGGMSLKDAARSVASEYGVARRLVYQTLLAGAAADGQTTNKEPAP